MYKYVSPIAKKLLPGPNVKKTEFHAVVNYPQIYAGTQFFGGPAADMADVEHTTRKCTLYPHISKDMRAQCLTMSGQGNTSDTRTGNSVDAKGLQLYLSINPPTYVGVDAGGNYTGDPAIAARPTGTDNGVLCKYIPNQLQTPTGAQCRVVVLLDKDFTGGRPPTVGDVFTDAIQPADIPGVNRNDIYSTNCQLKPDATQRFLVVMNKIVPVNSLEQIRTVKKNIKLDGVEIRYVQSDGAQKPKNCAQNTLWLFVLADYRAFDASQPAEVIQNQLPTYTYTARFRFLPK